MTAVQQHDVKTFQGMIAVLQDYWSGQGCLVQQPYDIEMGAGTFHSSTFLRAIGPEPWHACHTQPSRRPTDGRYGDNPNRLQHYYQFQVAMKPSPPDMQKLYLGSLEALGFDLLEHDVRFVEDNWESPTLGAWGLGWEVWLNGMEVTQYTYFQQCGGLACKPVLGELAYGIERLAMYIQQVESVYDLVWGYTASGVVSYGDVFHQNEVEQSTYNFEHADVDALFAAFDVCERECLRLTELGLPLPAYEQVLRGSHSFNLLDARHALSVTERQRYILRVRTMSRAVAESYHARREAHGFPLLRNPTDIPLQTTHQPRHRRMADSNRKLLLIEIGCEDLPAASVLPMATHLATALGDVLKKAGLTDSAPAIYATPRRIAATWPDVGERQADQLVERKGPAMAAAFKDGEPTKALAGFLKGAGAAVDDIETVETPKGAWVVIKQTKAGKTLSDLVVSSIADVIKTMPMPKRMRWSDSPHEFLRPVSWLLAIHGTDVVPLELFGLSAGNTTRGHRFHAPDAIRINNAGDYEQTLKRAYVQADFAARRKTIREQVDVLAEKLGGDAVSDDALLDEVTALVEWPVAVAGSFEESFLEIPKEALIQTMQENQRYFAMLQNSGANAGELMPAFITIANIESRNPQTVIDGNERVIRPRFEDTMFFWQQDKRVKLSDHLPKLSTLLFQEKLGSVADKVARLEALGAWLADKLGANVSDCVTAASLCKCDLNTEIVRELAKMQGIAGRYYAARDGHNDDISEAMEQHYFPKQAGGALPASAVSQVVSLADKVDTLVGIYGLGMKPTGAKDPFGLRRAALGIIRILIEKQHDVSLDELIDQSLASYGDKLPTDVDRAGILDYIIERLRGYAQDHGYSADVVDAVLAKAVRNPLDINARLQAIEAFRGTQAAVSLSAASKRSGNILKKAEIAVNANVNTALLSEAAEVKLFDTLQSVQQQVDAELKRRDYAQAMTITAELREPVDVFFDDVMVMSDDIPTRDNRLALLQQLNSLCSCTADLSRLQLKEQL